MKSSTGQFLVRPHNPLRKWLLISIAVIVAALNLWASYEYGRYRAGFNLRESEQQAAALQSRIDELELEKRNMLAANAILDRASQIDANARQDVTGRLEEVNQEMLELKEELVFYRSLLSPSDQKAGLHIQSFQLIEDDKESIYNYKLVLTQLRKNDRFATGKVNFIVDGSGEDGVQSVSGKELLTDNKADLSFRFKYFQSLEGSLVLPGSFKPEDIKVHVVPKGRRLQDVEQTYKWHAIIVGG